MFLLVRICIGFHLYYVIIHFSLIKTPLKIICDIIIRVLTRFKPLLNDIKSRLDVENH